MGPTRRNNLGLYELAIFFSFFQFPREIHRPGKRWRGAGGRKGGEGRGEVKERRRGEEVEKEVKRGMGKESERERKMGSGGRGKEREEEL